MTLLSNGFSDPNAPPVVAVGGCGGDVVMRTSVCAPASNILIGIAGPKRAGKDTLARGLCRNFHIPQESFAGPLRRFVADLLGISLDELERAKEDPIAWLDGRTPRDMMQTVGTAWGRDMVHPDLWVRALVNRVKGGCVISDVRFPNEARAIRERGGYILQVTRPGYGVGDAHISERPLPAELVDAVIENDSTPDVLTLRALVQLHRLELDSLRDATGRPPRVIG